jgi:hypothetical protein
MNACDNGLGQVGKGWLITALLCATAAANAPGNGFRLQEADQEVLPLAPVRSRSETTHRQLDSLSWFMTGRVWEIRGDRRKAFDAYKQAVEIDPQAGEVYRSLVPLAFQLELVDEVQVS